MKSKSSGLWKTGTDVFHRLFVSMWRRTIEIEPSFSGIWVKWNVNWHRLKRLAFFFFGDGLGDFCFNADEKRAGESGFTAGEPRPGEEPVCSGIRPGQEEECAVQRGESDRTTELPYVALRGAEPPGLRRRQTNFEEKDFRGSTKRYVEQ